MGGDAEQHWRDFLDALHFNRTEMILLYLPFILYWAVSLVYEVITYLQIPALEKYRLNDWNGTSARRNKITKIHVFWRVIVQQLIQFGLGVAVLAVDPHTCTKPPRGVVRGTIDFVLAMFVMDAWQYCIHRWMHVNTFLYKHIHSHHHQLYIPYAYGALYNHPAEAFILDALGGAVTLLATGMDCNLSIYFFSFATVKTVLDHCGYAYPVNPFHNLLPNTSTYHDVHHDNRGIKKNFSQPFFTYWDHILGTYMSPQELKQKSL